MRTATDRQPHSFLEAIRLATSATVVNYNTAPIVIDPALQAQSSDEFIVGGEYEIIADGRLGLSYTRRYMGNVIET